MKIVLNGDSFEINCATIQSLAAELTPAPETLLIEHNGVALHRSEWASATLSEGDRVEILRVAAGG